MTRPASLCISPRLARGASSLALIAGLAATPAFAQSDMRTELNFYGMPGLMDMPNALSMTDAQLSTTIGGFGGNLRYTLAFQIMPRLTGAFRYAYFGDADDPFSEDNPYWDRSFDLHYRFNEEGTYMPAFAIGVRDFIGTGLYSAEYIVATKTLPFNLRATAGIGWGRLGSYNGFDTGAGDRPPTEVGQGGVAEFDQFFRGPAAFFGGLEWQPTEKLGFAVEYSSDAYEEEENRFNGIEHKSPYNVAMKYSFNEYAAIGASYAYGDQFGVNLTLSLNPTVAHVGTGAELPPPPLQPRPNRADNPGAWGTEWTTLPNAEATLRENVAQGLASENLTLMALRAEATKVYVEFENLRYGRTSQALGRVARVLSNTMPASIEEFVLIPIERGMTTSAITLDRATLERVVLDHNAADGALEGTTFADAANLPRGLTDPDLFPRFKWDLGPYSQTSLFDPQQPFLIDLGAELSAKYEPVQGIILSGALRQKIVGNLDDSRLIKPQVPGGPPIVRLDSYEFNQYGDLTIPYLTAEAFFRPGENLYARLTAGYLERMYGGASAELLWQKPGNRLGLSAEVNYAHKRAYDQRFEFQDYNTVTGHVSAYYDFDNSFHAQLDMGRYLAEDWGGTFTLAREFDNGAVIGAYATLTDVPFEKFGEGSFDKGIHVVLPIDYLLGRPSRTKARITLQPVLRDGGARLHVRNRLYGVVRGESQRDIVGSWGRFWR